MKNDDYHGLDVVMNLSGDRRLPLRRPAEVGSSNNSFLFTDTTHTFSNKSSAHAQELNTLHRAPFPALNIITYLAVIFTINITSFSQHHFSKHFN
jgi:hypothetical protein